MEHKNQLRKILPSILIIILIVTVISCSLKDDSTISPSSIEEDTAKPTSIRLPSPYPTATRIPSPTKALFSPTESSIPETPTNTLSSLTITSIPGGQTNTPIVTTTPVTEIDDSGMNNPYQDKECGIDFIYPINWEVFPIEGIGYNTDCSLGLRPLNYDQVREESEILLNEYAFSLEVRSSSFDQATFGCFFVMRDDEWYVEGRHTNYSPAEIMMRGDYLLLRGEGIVGLYSKDTLSYIGLGSMERALLYNRNGRSMCLMADTEEIGEAFEMVLRTFYFVDD
jgi:hypothetical protein